MTGWRGLSLWWVFKVLKNALIWENESEKDMQEIKEAIKKPVEEKIEQET